MIAENFAFYKSDVFFETLQANVDLFINLIQSGGQDTNNTVLTPNNIIFSIVAEYILKTLFLAGSDSHSIFPKECKKLIFDMLPRFIKTFRILDNIKETVKAVVAVLTVKNKIDILTDQIHSIPRIDKYKKDILTDLIVLFYNTTISENEFISKLLTTYVVEHTKK